MSLDFPLYLGSVENEIEESPGRGRGVKFSRGTEGGAAENKKPDIARMDNAAPYSTGGHREHCFSVRVVAHNLLCLLQGLLYEPLMGFMF